VKTLAILILVVSALIMWSILIGGIIFAVVLSGHAAGSFTVKNWIALGVLVPIVAAIYFPILRWARRSGLRARERNRAYMEELRRRRQSK